MRELLPPISVRELIDAELIAAPSTAKGDYHGIQFEADLDTMGRFRWRGQEFESPSAAAAHALTGVTGRRTSGRAYLSVNGWLVWRVIDPSGNYRVLADLREEYRKQS